MLDGNIRGMYIMGENPAMSDPDAHHAREALAKLDCLVVQEIFLTETCYLADVILPATAWPEKAGTVPTPIAWCSSGARRSSAGRGETGPLDHPGARAPPGLAWNYAGPADVFNEMRKAMNSIAGITWERLEAESCVTYPCEKEGDPGQPVVFTDNFPTRRPRQVRARGHHPGRGAARREFPSC